MRDKTGLMTTNGKMARLLGIDPKTLRKWARKGLVPSYMNGDNGYRYYFKQEVLQALKSIPGNTKGHVDYRQRKN